jgi:hypothetical protein
MEATKQAAILSMARSGIVLGGVHCGIKSIDLAGFW